jgi:N-methylhydantoinase B
MDRVACGVQRALAGVDEGVGLAEVGFSIPAAWGVISGLDPRHGGAPFINQLILSGVTGGPGGPAADGWITLGGIGDAGQPFRDSVEIDEIAHPLRIYEQRLVPDREGAGRYRAAPAAYVEYGPVDTTMEVMFNSDGSINAPRGVRGGLDGACAVQQKRHADGSVTDLQNCDRVLVGPGESIISICSAGGGYGPPAAREPERVGRDVAEGFVTPGRAREVYRVAVDDAGTVDEAATRELRNGTAQ